MAELPGLFVQIVLLCSALWMADFRTLAIDGQKIQANGSFRNNVDRARAKEQLAWVRKGMEKLLEQEPGEALSRETIEERRRLERKAIRLAPTLATLEFLLLRLAGNIGKIVRYKAREFLAIVGGLPHYAEAFMDAFEKGIQ